MTELKTLKDLKRDVPIVTPTSSKLLQGVLLETELKAEAIKWVKELEKGMPQEAYIDVGRRSQKFTFCMGRARIDWIKYFFNLTEEDLK